MSRMSFFAIGLSLVSGIFATGCTMDAQLASSLLNSLKQAVDNNTDANGQAVLSAQDLSAAADAAGVRVVCGGQEMAIASHRDEADEDIDPETLIENADEIHPVMLRYGGAGRVQRIHIDVELAHELADLPKLSGPAREQQFRQIQGRYPQMRQARPIPVNAGQGRGVAFADFCDCPGQAQTGGRPQPMHAYAGRPVAGGFVQPPRRPEGQMGYARPVMAAEAMPAHFQGGHMGFAKPVTATAAVPARPGVWKGMPIDGFSDAKGQQCQLLAQTSETSEDLIEDQDDVTD